MKNNDRKFLIEFIKLFLQEDEEAKKPKTAGQKAMSAASTGVDAALTYGAVSAIGRKKLLKAKKGKGKLAKIGRAWGKKEREVASAIRKTKVAQAVSKTKAGRALTTIKGKKKYGGQSYKKQLGQAITKGAKAIVRSPLKSAGYAAAFWVAWRTLGAAISKAKRRCGVFGFGFQRKVCIAKVQAEEANRKISLIKTKQDQVCSPSKNPQACKEKFNAMIINLEQKRKEAMERLSMLKAKAQQKNISTQKGEEKASGKGIKLI